MITITSGLAHQPTPRTINAGRNGEASQSYGKESLHSLEWINNYSNSFGNHNLKAMFGYSYQEALYSGFNAENKDFPNDALEDNNLGTGKFMKKKRAWYGFL